MRGQRDRERIYLAGAYGIRKRNAKPKEAASRPDTPEAGKLRKPRLNATL